MNNPTEQIVQLKAAIETLEAQRPILGDAVVEFTLKTLQQKIAELETTPSSTTTPFQGERRQATILFSDLSGYTAMNEKLDPGKVQEIMGRIKAEAIRIVEHHEGTVNQFIGDEVVALFGIPHAHEDDPVRPALLSFTSHCLYQGLYITESKSMALGATCRVVMLRDVVGHHHAGIIYIP